MPSIHPTACLDAHAELADEVEIGPYCVIGPNVRLDEGCRLIAHVHIAGVTTVGPRTVIYPFASLGTPPQSVHYRGGPTRLVIGADCQIREGVTMSAGTEDGGGVTAVGDRGFFMANSHVGHDCQVGNAVTFANNVVLGGHVSVGDHAFFGGQVAVHQHARVGDGVMVAGLSGVAADVIPFGFASGQIAELVGLNAVGLRRRGTTRAEQHRLRRAYRSLFLGDGLFADRVELVAREFADDPSVARIIAFIRAGGNRPLMQPRRNTHASAITISDEPADR